MNDEILRKIIDSNVIIIYDGICGFCDATIQFVLERRPSEILRFVSFQSESGRKILESVNLDQLPDTILVIENGKVYRKSEAFFTILGYLNSGWRYLTYLSIVPSFISDFVYGLIAKNRYRLRGKTELCQILTKEQKMFFID